MDPEETLRQMRQLAFQLTDPEPTFTPNGRHEAGEKLAELTISLDEWLSKGGFLPSDWRR